MSVLLRLADAISAFTRYCSILATAILLGMIALVFYNVFGRYVIGGSPIWMQELEWHLMVPVALIGVSILILEQGHVRVDMLYGRFPEKVRHFIDFVSMLLGVVVAILFIKYSQGFLQSSWSVYEGSPDPGGLPGRYILKTLMPVCFALLALQCLANAIRHLADFLEVRK